MLNSGSASVIAAPKAMLSCVSENTFLNGLNDQIECPSLKIIDMNKKVNATIHQISSVIAYCFEKKTGLEANLWHENYPINITEEYESIVESYPTFTQEIQNTFSKTIEMIKND